MNNARKELCFTSLAPWTSMSKIHLWKKKKKNTSVRRGLVNVQDTSLAVALI